MKHVYTSIIFSFHVLQRFYFMYFSLRDRAEEYNRLLNETNAMIAQLNEIKELKKIVEELEKRLEQDKKDKETSKQNLKAISSYPISKKCYNFEDSDGQTIIKSLLSVSYGKYISEKQLAEELVLLAKKSFIIYDVFSIYAIQAQAKETKPAIFFVNEPINMFDPLQKSTTKAFYDTIDDYLVIPSYDGKYPYDSMVHEMVHSDMQIFGNDTKPYNTDLLKHKYHLAIKNTLINIKDFLNQNFKSNFAFKDQYDHHEMGKELLYWVFPQYLKEADISKYTDRAKEIKLDLNGNYCWLSLKTPLMHALNYGNEALADKLLTEGAILVATQRELAVLKMFNSFAYEWINKNTEKLKENAENYQANIVEENEICQRDNFLNEFDYFEDILLSYKYDKDKIDNEVIARFVQVIAKYKFEPSIIQIIQPMEDFWYDNIHPVIENLSLSYTPNDICLPIEYSEIN